MFHVIKKYQYSKVVHIRSSIPSEIPSKDDFGFVNGLNDFSLCEFYTGGLDLKPLNTVVKL